MRTLITTLAASAALLSTSAIAQTAMEGTFADRIGSFYTSANIGFNVIDDTDFNLDSTTRVDNEYDPGFTISAEVGMNYGELSFIDNVKLGLELGYTYNNIDTHKAGGANLGGSDGDLHVQTLLANMYHEFDTNSRFVPYYGIGIGLAYIDASDYRTSAISEALDDDDIAFAYQGTLGVDYIINADMDIGLRYRYTATEGAELTGSGAGASSSDFDYESNAFTVGLTYRF